MSRIEELEAEIKRLNKIIEDNKRFKDLFEKGLKYQDKIMYSVHILKMKDEGKRLVPIVWASEYYQRKLGESYCNIEVKYDPALKEYGVINIIAKEGNKNAGILQTRMKYYAIGNDNCCFIFKRELLVKIYYDLKRGKKYPNFEYSNNKNKEFFIIRNYRNMIENFTDVQKNLNDYDKLGVCIPVYEPYNYLGEIYPILSNIENRNLRDFMCSRMKKQYETIKNILG